MLRGEILVKYEEVPYTINIRGYDLGQSFIFYLSTNTRKDILNIDKGITTEDGTFYAPDWGNLYIKIDSGKVSVDCYMVVEGKVKYKSLINRELIGYLSSAIRGTKLQCNKKTLVSDDLYDEDFTPSQVNRYNTPYGYAFKDMQNIQELHYEDINMKIDLDEDGSYGEILYRQTNVFHNIKLDLSPYIEPEEDSDWDFEEGRVYSISEIIERNPDKNYMWIKDKNYKVVSDIKEVEQICQRIWKYDGIVSFDTETSGLDFTVECRQGNGDHLVGMVFSIEDGEAWYFPVAHIKVKNICKPEDLDYTLSKYFKPILEKKEIVCHNGAFDWKVMYVHDIFTNVVHDTMILFKVTLGQIYTTMSLKLKDLTSTYLGRDSLKLSDFVQGVFGQEVHFQDLDEESVRWYACADPDNTLKLLNYALEKDILGQYGAKKIYQIEVAFSLVIAYQEFYGHCVDMANIDSLRTDIAESLDREYKAMVDIVGYDFNPNSATQLQDIMFNQLKYPVIERTGTGNPSTGKGTQKALMAMKNPDGSDKYPLARHLHTYAEKSTLKSNFTKNIDKIATREGLCFSEVEQFLVTGRVSTKNPNYQAYSNTVKKYIIPRTGYYALDADYSSVEARIMVSMAGCKAMVEKLKDPDTDYHTQKASDMFNVPYELVTKELRQMSKGVNFGILYGLGDENLGKNLYGSVSPTNTQKAKKQKKLYFTGMEELEGFIDVSKHQGTSQFFSTTFFGRRRNFDIRTTNKNKIERQSCNARIQGTAADLYKLAMVRLLSQIRKNGWLGKILISGFIHDECFLEVSKLLDPAKVLKVLRKSMMIDIEGWCPLFIGCGFGRNWYEAKKTEIPVQLQESFINTYGDTGIDWWDGNTDKLYNWEVQAIYKYKIDRVLDFMKNPENQHGILKPTENSFCHEVVEDIVAGKHINGVVNTSIVEDKNDVIENLRQFCIAFDCLELFEQADLHKPEHKQQVDNTLLEDVPDIDKQLEISPEELLEMRMGSFGVYLDQLSGSRILYFRLSESPMVMDNVEKILDACNGDIPVRGYDVNTKTVYETDYKCSIRAYQKLLTLYLSYNNSLVAGG